MAYAHFTSRPLGSRVYRAILSQALPYVVYIGMLGTALGAFIGVIASIVSLDTLAGPIVMLYTIAGLAIGTAIGIRPVFRELRAFHWSADVLGK